MPFSSCIFLDFLAWIIVAELFTNFDLNQGVYNDNGSIVFHPGFGYGPQMPYGPYSPVTTPLPSVGGDSQLYSSQQFPFSGPYYQQLGPPSTPYITSPTPISQPELSIPSVDQQGDHMLFGPRPSYPPILGSFGGGNISGNLGTLGFHDLQQGFDGLRSGGLWSDWSNSSDRHRPLTPLSPAVSPQPIGSFGSYGHNVGMVCSIATLFLLLHFLWGSHACPFYFLCQILMCILFFYLY